MLDALLSSLESTLDDPFVRLDSLTFTEDGAVLMVSVMDSGEEYSWKRWRLEARGLRDYALRDAYGDLYFEESDHVLARCQTDTRQQLMFRDRPRSIPETIGNLWTAHRRIAGRWIPLERFMNRPDRLEELLALGYGQLADGPTFLVEVYAEVLTSAGVTPSLLPKHSAKRWDGESFREVRGPLATLLIGDSYFVAESFEASEMRAGFE